MWFGLIDKKAFQLSYKLPILICNLHQGWWWLFLYPDQVHISVKLDLDQDHWSVSVWNCLYPDQVRISVKLDLDQDHWSVSVSNWIWTRTIGLYQCQTGSWSGPLVCISVKLFVSRSGPLVRTSVKLFESRSGPLVRISVKLFEFRSGPLVRISVKLFESR